MLLVLRLQAIRPKEAKTQSGAIVTERSVSAATSDERMKPISQAQQKLSGRAMCVMVRFLRHIQMAQNANGQAGHRYQMKCLTNHRISWGSKKPTI